MPKLKEVEIRILLKNRGKIEQGLKCRGAKLVYFQKLKDYWYCPAAARDYKEASIDSTGFALRIRESVDRYTGKRTASLECKTLCDGKTHAVCNEYEVDVPEIDETRKILQSIGLKEFLIIDKERIIYELDNIKFCFDEIKGVGEGLEIEVMTDEDIEKIHTRLTDLALDIGVTKQEILEKSLTYIAMQKIAKF